MHLRRGVRFVIVFLCWMPVLSLAQSPSVNTIVIKDHQFNPSQLIIPAGQKVKITVDNQDSTPEEFESYDFNREKIVSGHKKVIIFIGPLKAGSYKFFGDFHLKSAQGVIVVQQ